MNDWWTDPAQLRAAIETHGNSTRAAKALGGVTARNVQRNWKILQAGGDVSPGRSAAARAVHSDQSKAARDAKPEMAKSKQTDTTFELTSAANPQDTSSLTPEQAIERATGIPASEWDYQFSKNQWDVLAGRDPDTGEAVVATMHQLKVSATRRPETFFAFELPAGWTPDKSAARARKAGAPRRIGIFSDPHAPSYQEELVEASVAWLEERGVDELWCLGDAADNSPFGRHGINRRTDCTVQQAVWGTTELLMRWSRASEGARRVMRFGNHDYWLTKRILEIFPKLMELKLYGEDVEHLAISTILKLEQIGWEFKETAGEYHDVTDEIVPGLTGMHGTRTGPKGGAPAEFAKWEGTSIIQGHDHTLAMLAMRKRLAGGGLVQRYAISAGSMADPNKLGYDPAKNIGQGWPVLEVWDDGRWHVDFALYDPVTRSTTWRDWRYDA